MNKKVDTDEMKQIELEILNEIDSICKEYKINYFLFGGTLLGAVRHKGFIPWDDDIDICMLRKDYTKFEKVMTNICNDKIRFLSVKTQLNYLHCFGKVIYKNSVIKEPGIKETDGLGIFVDVFPIDNAPVNKFKQLFLKTRLYILYKFRWLSSLEKYVPAKNKFLNCINYGGYLYANIHGPFYYAEKINRVAQNQPFEGAYINSTGWREIFSSEVFRKSANCEFEGKEFPIPIGYDELLRTLYGDYMILPPEDQRHPGHDIEAYLVEDGR